MPRVLRKDGTLNDAIEYLDQAYVRAGNDVYAALGLLSADENAFIETETEKCLNLRYYLENYHCISDENGNFRALYPWWEHQEIVYEATQEEWAENGCCKIIILKPRQAGITVWIAASMFHGTIFTPHCFTMLVAQNPVVSTAMQKMCLNAYHALPWWLRPEYMYKTKGDAIDFQRKDEKQRLVNPGLGSVIQVTHAAKASGVAIGRTLRNLHASEVSRWPSGEVFHSDIKPSMNARDTYAVMESTGLGRNGLFYEWWQGSMDGDTGWRPLFIPVYKVKKYYLPIRLKGGVKFELTTEETAFSQRTAKEEKFAIPPEFWNFRRQGIRAAKRGDGKAGFLESYPITPAEAFQGSGICAFDAESLEEQQMNYICKPLWAGEIFLAPGATTANLDGLRAVGDQEVLAKRKGSRPTDRLHVWAWPSPGETYYVAADVALGVQEGDYSVAQVFLAGVGNNPDEQVAEWWGHIPPEQFAQVLAALGYWYHGAEIACEYEKDGITTGNKLVEMDYPALYRERLKDRPGSPYKVYFHFSTTQKTRSSIIARMNEALLTHNQRGEPGVILHSEECLDEMIDFASIYGSKMEGQGNHDDGIMALMIALYCLRETTQHLKAVPESATLGHSSGDLNVYGLFDHLRRQRGQYSSRGEAERLLGGHPGWSVVPILICAANTLASPIDTPGTAEHALRYQHGLSRSGILPDVVSAYRDAVGFNGYGRRGALDTSDPDW
jgi:hypothetical protein